MPKGCRGQGKLQGDVKPGGPAPYFVSVQAGAFRAEQVENGTARLVEQLAGALGAEVAATRPVCDNGWLPGVRQVGSSGQTVSPKVYVVGDLFEVVPALTEAVKKAKG